MLAESHDVPEVLRIYLQITLYPILADTIRERMRQEIFRRGIVTRERFEAEAKEKAILSQQREGVANPYLEETAAIWERRLGQVRDYLTDFYFAYNLPHSVFEEIVQNILQQRKSKQEALAWNPELASWDLLIRQAELYETMAPGPLERVRHHLQETKVVLIKQIISDQLAFVRLAKEYLTTQDLQWIYSRRIGNGKIGGKAAGLVLAWKILQQTSANQSGPNPPPRVAIPESYFIGTDVFYEYLGDNDLNYYVNQKYKPLDMIEREYPELIAAYGRGRFRPEIEARLREMLERVASQPLIVRSSSLLEDNFDASFAGKYESVFCPNQGTADENLAALTQAVARVYASVANPNAILYRKQIGLLDYDERMAVLIQVVQGDRYHDCFFPQAAGVAFSRNPFIWNPKLRREDGFLRIVVGLGTRAVDRVAEDYPRMVALSHPQLRPESDAREVRYYSQHRIDLLDLTANCFATRPISEVLAGDYPGLRFLASLHKDDYISPMVFNDPALDPRGLVMTFDGLLSKTPFVEQMKAMLRALEFGYGRPVDIEFTAALQDGYPRPELTLHLLQCRPQSGTDLAEAVAIPDRLPEQDIIFGAAKLTPTGRVRNIAYIVYVDPERYATADPVQKRDLARQVGRLNQRLEGQQFILMGPGRWGSSNPDLGLKVGYKDIYNTRVLVEIGWPQAQGRPTLSYGTHFFQDLVEANIYPLAIYPGEPGNPFQKSFFDDALNAFPVLVPDDARYHELVKVINVPAATGGRVLEVVMSGEKARAVAFLTRPSS